MNPRQVLCNPCGLYERTHEGKPRPVEFNSRSSLPKTRRRNSSSGSALQPPGNARFQPVHAVSPPSDMPSVGHTAVLRDSAPSGRPLLLPSDPVQPLTTTRCICQCNMGNSSGSVRQSRDDLDAAVVDIIASPPPPRRASTTSGNTSADLASPVVSAGSLLPAWAELTSLDGRGDSLLSGYSLDCSLLPAAHAAHATEQRSVAEQLGNLGVDTGYGLGWHGVGVHTCKDGTPTSPLEALARLSSTSSIEDQDVVVHNADTHNQIEGVLMAWAADSTGLSNTTAMATHAASANPATLGLGRQGAHAACAAALEETTRQRQQPSSSLLTMEQLIEWVESCSQSAAEHSSTASVRHEEPGTGESGVLGDSIGSPELAAVTSEHSLVALQSHASQEVCA